MNVSGRRGRKRFGAKFRSALFDFDTMIYGQIFENLGLTTGPANAGAHDTLRFSQPEEKFLTVLRQKARTGLEIFRLPKAAHLEGDCRPDGIAIALFALQAKGDRRANVLHRIVQDADLRRGAILQNDFQPSVVIQVRENKATAVIDKIQ